MPTVKAVVLFLLLWPTSIHAQQGQSAYQLLSGCSADNDGGEVQEDCVLPEPLLHHFFSGSVTCVSGPDATHLGETFRSDVSGLSSYVRAGEDACVEVFWSPAGVDAPVLDDQDQDGIPDYVQMVEREAHEVLVFARAQGFLPPLALNGQGELVPCSSEYRVPLVLRNFDAGDGQFVREACDTPEGGAHPVCSGTMFLENDFAEQHYDSVQEAVRIVVSHELFHAVQSAYVYELSGWISEGTATWFEEFYDAEQSDFERLTRLYFSEHTRRLSDRQRGPGDGFAYGASLFFYYLASVYGDDVILNLFSVLSEGVSEDDAFDTLLHQEGHSLPFVFADFARWNLFTGTRAQDGYGYDNASRFAMVGLESLENVDRAFDLVVKVDPLAAKYTFFQSTRVGELSLRGADGWPTPWVELVSLDEPTNATLGGLLHEGAVRYEANTPYVLMLTASGLEGTHAGYVSVRPDPVVDEMEDMGLPQMDMGGEDMGMDMSSEGLDEDMESEDMPSDLTILEPTESEAGGCSVSAVQYDQSRGVLPAWLFVFCLVFFKGLPRLFRRRDV